MICLDIQKLENLELKKEYVSDVLNSIQTFDTDPEAKAFIESFKNTNESGLSLEEKLIIIEEAAASAPSNDLKLKLLDFKQEVKATVRYYDLRIVKGRNLVPEKVPAGEKDTFFNMNFGSTNRLIPILGNEQNAFIVKQLHAKFFYITKLRKTGGKPVKITSQLDLARSMHGYRMSLLWELYNWIGGFTTVNVDMYAADVDDNSFNEAYKVIMRQAWQKINHKLSEQGSSVLKPHLDSRSISDVINPITAFYLLLNFDLAVEFFSRNTVNVLPAYKGTTNNFLDKYIKRTQDNPPGSFEDVYDDIDGDKVTSKLLVWFLQTITSDNGKPLTSETLNRIVAEIHYLLENGSNSIKNTLMFIVYGDNPENVARSESSEIARINALITYLNNFETVHNRKVSIGECKALASALKEYMEAHWGATTDSIKDSADLSDENLGQLFLQCLQKSVMTYGMVNEDRVTEQKSMLTHNKTKAGIWGALQGALKDSLKLGLLYMYKDGFLLYPGTTWDTFDDILSPRAQLVFLQITGISLQVESLLLKLMENPHNLEILGKFLRHYRLQVMLEFGHPMSNAEIDAKVGGFMERIKQSQEFIEFSDMLVEDDSSATIKILDGNNNAVPIIGTHTTISHYKRDLEEFRSLFGAISAQPSNNTLLRFPELTRRSGFIDDNGQNQGHQQSHGFISHIVFATDAAVGTTDKAGKLRIVKTLDLSVAELAAIGIGSDYLSSIVRTGTMLTQIEAYSDKVRIAKGAWNLASANSKTGKRFLESGIKALETYNYEQHVSYYSAVELKICQDWGAIFDTNFENIQEVWQYFEVNTITEDDLRKALLEYQRYHPDSNINILREVHYSIYANGRIGINPILYQQIINANNHDLYQAHLDSGYSKFLLNIKNFDPAQISKILTEDSIEKLTDDEKLRIIDLFFEISEDGNLAYNPINKKWYKLSSTEKVDELIKAAADAINEVSPDENNTSKWLDNVTERPKNQILDFFLHKYFLMNALFREADLQVMLKHAWCHDKVHSGNTNKRLSDFNALFTAAKASLSTDVTNELPQEVQKLSKKDEYKKQEAIRLLQLKKYNEAIEPLRAEFQVRLSKSKKRFNAGPASFAPFEIGNKYGVPRQMKIAHVEHARLMVFNYFGNNDELNSHDGAIMSTGITRRLERHSASNRKVSSTLKTIMLQPEFAGFMQIKCADFEMSNTWIRWTLKNNNEYIEDFNGIEIFYKMLSPAKLTMEFVENWRSELKELGHNFYYDFAGRRALLTNIEQYWDVVDQTAKFKFEWTYLDNNEVVPADIVTGSLFDTTKTIEADGSIAIDNLFDLWQAFGGAYCLSQQSDGTIAYSDASLEVLADLMSEYDETGSMKSGMIHKLIDEEASKSSQGIKNAKSTLQTRYDKTGKLIPARSLENDWVVQWFDANRYGIQLDYGHQADGSTIPMLTQVVTAVAFNGENSELVQQMYRILGQVVEESLLPFIDKWEKDSDHSDFHKYMGKSLLRALETNSVASNAEEIIRDLYNRMHEWNRQKGGVIKTIPYSDPQVFFLATSHLISKLNTSTLKQEFQGIAVVQNPANGIVGVYEDVNGILYTQTDITEMANDWIKSMSVEEVRNKFTVINTDDGIERLNLTQEAINQAFLNQSSDFAALPIGSTSDFSHLGIGDIITLTGESYTRYVLKQVIENGTKKSIWVKEVVQIPANQSIEIKIDNPLTFKLLYNEFALGNLLITKLRARPRDLATTKITWQSEIAGDPGNLWLLDSTFALIESQVVNKGKRDITLEKWHQDNLRGLRSEKPYVYFTKEDYVKGIKTYLTQTYLVNGTAPVTVPVTINYLGGEEILPKKYKTALGLNDSMAKIKKDPEYFHKLAERRAKLDPSLQAIFESKDSPYGLDAIYISKEGYDIVLTSTTAASNTDWIYSLGKWRIMDNSGNFIEGIEFIGDENNPPEYQVELTRLTATSKPTVIFHTLGLAKENLDYFYNGIKEGVYIIYSNNKDSEILSRNSSLYKKLGKDVKKYVDVIAQRMRVAFETSTNTISARIPSQAFQSFLANKTVGYTETDNNDGYMNIWEMWFQGSDYDIDKAYTMMYELDSHSGIAGNIYTRDCLTSKGVAKSLLLPIKNNVKFDSNEDHRVNPLDPNDTLPNLVDVIKEAVNEMSPIGDLNNDNIDLLVGTLLLLYPEELREIKRLELVESIVNKLEEGEYYYVPQELRDDETNTFVPTLITYVTSREGMGAHKNRVMQSIYAAASDLRNLKAAEVPMESGEVGREIEKQSAGKTPEYHDLDPFTLWQIQRENAVGKKDVGIAANSIKAAGALQQHFNLLKDNIKKAQTSKISLDLKFNIKDRVTKKDRVIKDSFTRLANTKVSREVFEQQLKGFPANELSLVEGVSPIEVVIENNNQQVLKAHRHGAAYTKFWENYYRIAATYGIGPDANMVIIQEKLLASDTTLESILQAAGNATIAELGLKRSKDIRFVLVLKSYAETYINRISEDGISYKNARMLDGTNGSQFIDVLYYGLEFEPNVADTLSIFISLATDNAKELKLSKMYGRPELLSLPLAMITLGMDIDEVIDICINLLGPISDELDKSRYEGHVKTDVREIIGNLVDKNVFDKETADSLYKIYDTAQELRALTSFFKVNQGVTAKYSELVLFLQGLSKLKIEASKHVKNLDKEQYPEIEKAIDFDRLFTDSDYQKQLLGEYEATKSCFNVLEIVLGSPHFSQLLRSIQTTTKLIEDSTGKGRIMKELNLSEMFDDKLNKESELKFQNRVLRLVDSYVIEQALHNMSDVSFTAGDLREKFPNFRLDLKKDVIVGLQNSHQIEHFLHFVDKILIPQLKAEYPNNFFFANLTVKEDKQTGLSYWDIPFDPFDAKQSLFTAENLNMAAVAFEEIAPHNLGVRTVSGKDMTIGDIMYLYTLITSRNLIRGSMTCVYQAIKDTSPYLREVSRQYQIIDKLAQNASMQIESSDEKLLILNELLKNQSAQEISNIVETLRPYVKALRKEDGRDKFTRGTEGNEVVENYSVKEFFLPTLSKGTTHGTFTIDDSNIPNTSKYLANIFVKRAAASLHMSESEFNGVYNPIVRLEKIGNSNSYQLTILMQYSQGENGKVIQLEPYRYTFTPEEGSMPYSVLDSFFDFVTANTSGLTLILSSKGYSGEFKESSIITDEIEKENLRENLNLENSLDNDIFNYCTKQSHRWVKTRKGNSRLINIGNNKENPVRIPMVNADEFSIIDAARLYFLSTHGVMSENQLMVALVNSFLAEDAQISDIYQVYEVFNDSEFIDKVKSSKAALVLIDHLKNQETTESIKRLANIALTKYLRAMSYRDIYYRKDSNMSKLKEGDIFEFDGTEYMYVALTEFGSYVLRKITQLNNPNVPDVLVKIELDLQNEGKKKLSLQILSNLIINDFNHTSYSYNQSTPESLNIKNKAIQIGDKISNGFDSFYVKDIIYVETSDGKLELKYVVYDIDLDASYLTLKSDSDFTTDNWTHQTPDVRINLYTASAVGDQLLISHFSDELKRWVLQQADPASITIMVNNEYLSISRVNHNNVVTVEGSLIPFSSIQGITISSFSCLNDPRFEMRSHAARIETKYWDEDSSIYLAMPEFKHGFVETERKSDSKYQIYVAAVTDGNGDIQYSLQPGDSDYLGLVGDDTSDVLTGDILYDYKRNILYKVANKQLGIYYKMSRTKASNPVKVNGKDVLTTARREIVQLNDALLKELSLFRVAGSNSVRKVARFKNNSNTASDICDHLLSYLAEKFNTTVELVNDPTDISFAKVTNGRIIINMANKPNNISDSNYILEQGIHEFTHLVLAYLQANYPSLYIELLDKVEQIEGISDEVYKYDVTKREEALVRLITQNLAKNNQWMDSTDGKAAYDALIRAFKYLFDDDTLIPDNSDGFLERSIQSAISIFSDNWKTDIISLLMQRVTDELFNQIRKC